MPKNDGEEPKYWPEKVIGGKYVRLLERQLQKLRGENEHGNRKLFFDDVFSVYLLAYFNPIVRSLRTIEDFSQTVQVQKHLSIRKMCKSTLSDFNQLADPTRLVPIMNALRKQLARKQANSSLPESDLQALLKQTIAVDGTFVPAMADVSWAVANSNDHGAVRHRARLDTHLNISTGLPEAIVVPQAGQSEANSAIEHLQPGKIYVYDRGYMSFALLRAHYAPGNSNEGLSAADATPRSHFVVRFKPAGGNSPELRSAVDRPLTDEDREAGVVSDRVGFFTSSHSKGAGIERIAFREVVVEYEEQGQTKTLRLITNLLDVSAKTIGILYRYRWQVELFFRWLKSVANFGHLISHSRDGMQAHLYVTIIAVMLMYLHTGYRPSKYMFALVGQVAQGSATLDEIMPILRERERQCERDRLSQQRRAAKKKAQG